MSPEFWSIISVGIVILIAIATSNRALRGEMNEMSRRIDALSERIAAVQLEMNERFGDVNERIAAVRAEMNERFREMGERLSRVEGLLEGIGYAWRNRAGKERSDGEDGPALPQR